MEFTKFLDPRNDIVFKDLFGTTKNKDIVIDFINDIMEYQGDEKIKSVHLLQTMQDPGIAARKRSNVDILMRKQQRQKNNSRNADKVAKKLQKARPILCGEWLCHTAYQKRK